MEMPFYVIFNFLSKENNVNLSEPKFYVQNAQQRDRELEVKKSEAKTRTNEGIIFPMEKNNCKAKTLKI